MHEEFRNGFFLFYFNLLRNVNTVLAEYGGRIFLGTQVRHEVLCPRVQPSEDAQNVNRRRWPEDVLR